MAEEFRFEQVARNRGSVDRDEGCVLAWAVTMQGARHQLLAGARLAVDQYCRVGGRKPADGAEDFLQRRTLPQNLGHSTGFQWSTIVVLSLCNRPAYQIHGLVDIEGLGQVFECAALECRYR